MHVRDNDGCVLNGVAGKEKSVILTIIHSRKKRSFRFYGMPLMDDIFFFEGLAEYICYVVFEKYFLN